MEFHKLSDIFPMMNDDEYQRLVNDIKDNGLLEPIIIYEDKILDGRNRYKACQELDIEVKTDTYDGNSPLQYVISKNLARRHLNESQRSMVGARLANMTVGRNWDNSDNCRNKISQDNASKALNISSKSIERANKVIESGTPELSKSVDDGKVAVSLAAKVAELLKDKQEYFVKKIEDGKKPTYAMKEIIREIALEQKANLLAPNYPDKKYDVIVIDPPWEIQKIQRDVRPNQQELDYPTMSIDEIKNIPISELASENCMLFLWVIDKYLFTAKEIIEYWGFNYHLTMSWDKGNGISMYGFHRQTEFIVVGFKGKHEIYPQRKTIRTSFFANSDYHSAKPDEFYQMLDILEGNKIDIFARKKREGWEVYGNEVA